MGGLVEAADKSCGLCRTAEMESRGEQLAEYLGKYRAAGRKAPSYHLFRPACGLASDPVSSCVTTLLHGVVVICRSASRLASRKSAVVIVSSSRTRQAWAAHPTPSNNWPMRPRELTRRHESARQHTAASKFGPFLDYTFLSS